MICNHFGESALFCLRWHACAQALSGQLLSFCCCAVPAAPAAPAPEAPAAPGSAGELKLYDTDPRDAAMIMAIVADTLGKPINQLRFISIKEVKEDEV